MAEEPEEKRCDPDDILCEMELLMKMRNLKSAFVDEDFRKEFPLPAELSDKLDESIKEMDADIRAKLEACNLPMEVVEQVGNKPVPETMEEETHPVIERVIGEE